MHRALLVLFAIPFQACILYDGDCEEGSDCWDRPDDSDSGGSPTDDTGLPPDDTGPLPPPWAFELVPGEAEAGDVFIASLRFEGDAAPAYDTVASVEFFGDVEVLATDWRAWEILLTLAVSADAPEGTADVLVRFQGTDAAWGEDVLSIWPDASGHEAGPSGSGLDPCTP
ncbi:MAG: hypothetical protein JXB39_07725 [Deltaproteobacteria bacterium]|nr:hypothetical protein [Deltaproteobacteria bacterium]